MDNKEKRNNIRFMISLEPATKHRLDLLAKELGLARSHTVAFLVNNFWNTSWHQK